jgi:hypothetical protein
MNTDDYEGHTEGPWDADAPLGIHLKVGQTISAADARLIAAAPDLLKEVKRLREELESIQNSMGWTVQVWWNENYMGREGWMQQMCEVYTDLAKGIETQYHGEEEGDD